MNRYIALTALIPALLAAACSPARVALSPELAAATQPMQITGMGFGETGRFQLGGSSGTFYRHALSARQLPPFADQRETIHYGDGGFTVSGPDFDGALEASCRHRESEVVERSTSFTVAPFRYECAFRREGRPLAVSLTLSAVPRPVAGFLATEGRRGELRLDGRNVVIEPIYTSPDLKVPTGDPLGYRFIENGRELGAIDLNGERKTLFVPHRPTDREAVLMAGLALSVLWRS